jgi:putative PIN family toxin of toxin-antitoxin system
MIIVLDTNVVLQALNQRHPTAVILHAWYSGRFVWALSTDILMEYQEVIVRQSGPARWQTLGRLLDLAVVHGHNTQRVSPAFFFRTISADRDGDKFADCAIAAHADFIITCDKHLTFLSAAVLNPSPSRQRSLSFSISQPRKAMLKP